MNSLLPDPPEAAGASVTAHTRVQGDERIGCGEFLHRARQRSGLTLQQVAQSTKIPLRHLDALERDDFAALPGGMYRRAQVRAFAEAVGLDRHVALAWLDRALAEAMPPAASVVENPVPPPMLGFGRSRVSMIGGVAVAAAMIVLALWARQPASDHIASTTDPVTAPVSRVVPASYAPADVLVTGSGGAVEPAGAPATPRSAPATQQDVSDAPPAEPADETTTAASGAESRLTVITQPAGARTTVDGIGWGMTPVTIRYLEPGAKRVRVTMDGYRAEERVVEVEAGRATTTLRIQLQNAD